MKPKILYTCTASILSVALLVGCMKMNVAPVYNLGLKGDSRTGAMIVNAGDTLWRISQKYDLPLRAIIDVNRLSPPYELNKGQRLKLPPPMHYQVHSGDTLYSIARMFDVSVYKLVRHNALTKPYTIHVGQRLRIPYSPSQQGQRVARSKTTAQPKSVSKSTKVQSKRSSPAKPKRKSRPAPVMVNDSRRPDFVWPVKGKVISSYGAKKNGLYNDGINIAVPKRAPVVAAADGTVAYVGNALKSYGNLVLIRHGGGMTTAYAHLDKAMVKKGQRVKKKQVIGRAGASGNVSSTQLHFEIRKKSKTYDPMKYL